MDDLEKLLKIAKGKRVSASEREEQRRSFAYGNTNIENERITRGMIDEAAEELRKTSRSEDKEPEDRA